MLLQEPHVLEKSFLVRDQDAIHFMGENVVPVLATPILLMWMEQTCRENIKPLLNAGEDTVGVMVEMKHLAATPVGLQVRIISKLVDIEGRLYRCELEAFDKLEKIAVATHQRASVHVVKFGARVEEKRAKVLGAR